MRSGTLRRWLREPLVHFLAGGAALFLLYGAVGDEGTPPPDRIVVDEARVASLAAGFERTWMRPPTRAELQGLIEDHVIEEILYREALALGLDRDDLVVRRRMRQKMEFLNEGLTERAPSDEELRSFLAAHPERFREPARLSLVQVFLAPGANGEADEDVAALLQRLRRGEAPEELGDRTLLPRRLARATPAEIARTFGEGFAKAVVAAPEGVWSGPVGSGFGTHLVHVTVAQPERLPAFDEVRAAVEREWTGAQREEARERFHDALRARYEVEVHLPTELAASGAANGG